MSIMRLFERPWIWLAVAVNVAGAIYGFYWYELQLVSSPIWQWAFIADCPISATLMAVHLTLKALGRTNETLKAVATCSSFKYGIWTCLIILAFRSYFLSPERRVLYVGMFLAHALLAGEGYLEMGGRCSVALIWLLINDLMDYVVGTHPYLPAKNVEWVGFMTVTLTILSFYLCKRAAAGI